jgi:hypothetical protein
LPPHNRLGLHHHPATPDGRTTCPCHIILLARGQRQTGTLIEFWAQGVRSAPESLVARELRDLYGTLSRFEIAGRGVMVVAKSVAIVS